MRWPKYWSFSFSISPSNEHPGLISFKWTGWISLQSKGLSGAFSNTIVQKHQFFGTQLSSQSNSHIHTCGKTTVKTIALTRRTFVDKAMSLLFNMLSRLVCKEIQPVRPKGDQFWVFCDPWTDAEAETPILWPPRAKS